jgi:hypothetical protein
MPPLKKRVNHPTKASADARRVPPRPLPTAAPPLPPLRTSTVVAPSSTPTIPSTATPSTPTTVLSPLRRSSPRFSASPPLAIPLGGTKEAHSSSANLSCRKKVDFVNDLDNEDDDDIADDDVPDSADTSKSAKKTTNYTDDMLREIYYKALPPEHRIRKTKLKQDYPGNSKEPQIFGVAIDQIVIGPLPGYEDVVDVDENGKVKEGPTEGILTIAGKDAWKMTLKYLRRLTTRFGHSTRSALKGDVLHLLYEIIKDAPPRDPVARSRAVVATSPSKKKKQPSKQSKKTSVQQLQTNAVDDDDDDDDYDDNYIDNNDDNYINNNNIYIDNNDFTEDDNHTTKPTKKSNSVPRMLNICFSNKFYHSFNNHAAKATKEQLDAKTAGKKSFWDLVFADFVTTKPNPEYDNNIFVFDEVPSGRFQTALTNINPGDANRSVKESKVLYKWWCEIRQRWSVARDNKNVSGRHSPFWQFCNGSVDLYYLQRWMKEKNFDSVQLVDTYLPKRSDSLDKSKKTKNVSGDDDNDGVTKKKIPKKQKLEADKKAAMDKEASERKMEHRQFFDSMKIVMKQSLLTDAIKEWEVALERSFPDDIDDIYDKTAASFLLWLERGQRRIPKMLYSKWLRKEELADEILKIKFAEGNGAAVASSAAPKSVSVSEFGVVIDNPVAADVAASIEALYAAEPEVSEDTTDAYAAEVDNDNAGAAALSPATWNKKYPEEFKDEFDSDNSSMNPRLFPDSNDDDDNNKKPRAKGPARRKNVAPF